MSPFIGETVDGKYPTLRGSQVGFLTAVVENWRLIITQIHFGQDFFIKGREHEDFETEFFVLQKPSTRRSNFTARVFRCFSHPNRFAVYQCIWGGLAVVGLDKIQPNTYFNAIATINKFQSGAANTVDRC